MKYFLITLVLIQFHCSTKTKDNSMILNFLLLSSKPQISEISETVQGQLMNLKQVSVSNQVFIIHSKDSQATFRTNDKGEFHIQLKQGTYKMEAKNSSLSIQFHLVITSNHTVFAENQLNCIVNSLRISNSTTNNQTGIEIPTETVSLPVHTASSQTPESSRFDTSLTFTPNSSLTNCSQHTVSKFVSNLDFELFDELNQITNWTLLTTSTSPLLSANSSFTDPYNGSSSAYFKTLTTSISGREARSSCISVESELNLHASIYLKTVDNPGHTKFGMKFYFYTDSSCTNSASTPYQTQTNFSLNSNQLWEEHTYSLPYTEIPSNGQYMNISLRAMYISGLGSSNSKIYMDALTVRQEMTYYTNDCL